MALTVDTIETVLKARVGDYIRNVNSAREALEQFLGTANKDDGKSISNRASVAKKTADAEISAEIDGGKKRRSAKKASDSQLVSDEIATQSKLTAASKAGEVQRLADIKEARERLRREAAQRDAAAITPSGPGPAVLPGEKSRLLSGTSLSAAPGQEPVSTRDFVRDSLVDQTRLRSQLTAASIAGDQAAATGLQNQIRGLQAVNAYLRQGLTLEEAQENAKEDLLRITQAQAAAEARATAAGIAGSGRAANATRNLGRQFQDIGVGLVGGQGVFLVLAQQIPQVADALTDMAPKAGLAGAAIKTLQFFATPTGAIILALASAVAIFGSKLFDSTKTVEDSVEALRKESREAEVNRQAKERFRTTLEGVTDALRENKKALDELDRAEQTAAERANVAAQNNLNDALEARKKTRDELKKAQDDLAKANSSPEAGLSGSAAAASLARLKKQLADAEQAVSDAQARLNRSRGEIAAERSRRQGEALASPDGSIQANYDRQVKALEAAEKAEVAHAKNIQAVQGIQARYTEQIRKLTVARDADIRKIKEQSSAESAAAKQNRVTLLSPVSGGRVTSGIGARARPTAGASTNHNGIDIAVPVGTPVQAGANGTVKFAGQKSGFGNAVIIDYGSGTLATFGHLSEVLVKTGEKIEAGQKIALTGNTGVSTGPHLHYEDRTNGKVVEHRNPVRVGDQGRAEASDLAQEQREREIALQNTERHNETIARLNDQIEDSKSRLAVNLKDQTAAALANVDREKENADKAYADDLQKQKLDAATLNVRLEEYKAATQRLADSRKGDIKRADSEQSRREASETASATADLTESQLRYEADSTNNLKRKAELEQKIIDVRYDALIAAQESLAANKDLSDHEREQAQLAADRLRVDKAGEKQSTSRDAEGPLARYRREVGDVGENINQSLEQVQVDGLKGLEDGLTGVITQTKSVGDAFKQIADQIIADLVRIAVQRAIIAPLLNVLSGGGGGGDSTLGGIGALAASSGAGFAGNDEQDAAAFAKLLKTNPLGKSNSSGGILGFLSLLAGARATGGPVSAGKVYRVNEHSTEYFQPSQDGRVIPLGQMNARPSTQTTVISAPQFNLKGAVVTQQLVREMQAYSDASSARAGQASYRQSMLDAPTVITQARRFGR